jgi:hypothetical protein
VPGPGNTKAEVSITSFAGDVGGTVLNINRWRKENGLADTHPDEITSTPATVDAILGKLYDISGPSARTIVAVIRRDAASWFFKLRGDPDAVAAAEPAFLQFLASIHFGGADSASPPPSSADTGPAWDVPPGWIETTPGPMVTKSFNLTGDAGQKAIVSISAFGVKAGGVLDNVNRWRRQVSLPEIGEDALPGALETFALPHGTATIVDLTGTGAESGLPTRLVAAIVPRSDATWFYKLMGDPAIAAREKDAFLKFIQSARYP